MTKFFSFFFFLFFENRLWRWLLVIFTSSLSFRRLYVISTFLCKHSQKNIIFAYVVHKINELRTPGFVFIKVPIIILKYQGNHKLHVYHTSPGVLIRVGLRPRLPVFLVYFIFFTLCCLLYVIQMFIFP